MTATIPQLVNMLTQMGSNVTFHREDGGSACPCRTDEGFRDPAFHRAYPGYPICNEQGFLAIITEFTVKASVQPANWGYRRANQRVNDIFGEIQKDDKLGIFPCNWSGHVVDFRNWSDAGEDYILYDGQRYICVAADKVPDIDGDPAHHWEVGLRLLKSDRPEDASDGFFPDTDVIPDVGLFPGD